MRCLEPDPAQRPVSALAVAAALPGGDPLAAALTAGETPSPEMVAAAGEKEGIRPPIAVAAILTIITGLLIITVAAIKVSGLGMMPLPLPPEVLAVRAQEITSALGYSERPVDHSWQWYYQTEFAGISPPGVVQFDDPPATQSGMSGTPNTAGPYTFAMQVEDSVGNSGTTCGPPTYPCSRSDLLLAPNPAVPPKVGPNNCVAGSLNTCGNLTGANTVIKDPDFGNRIVRVTDSQTAGGSTMIAGSTGSADPNMWNSNSTYFVIQDTASSAYLFSFNPSTMQTTKLGAFPFLPRGNVFAWSFTNPKILYRMSSTKIYKYDFTGYSGGSLPSPSLFFDFNSSGCLQADPNWNANPRATTRTIFTISTDGQNFSTGFSNAGGQGTGFFSAIYKIGSGCRVFDTKSGTVHGQWGFTGAIPIGDRFTMHEQTIGKSGDYILIDGTACLSSTCLGSSAPNFSNTPYFWQVSSTNVNFASGARSGHYTEGHRHWMNNCQCNHLGQDAFRLFTSPNKSALLILNFPPGMTVPFDQHFSWNNADANDTYPFISSSWTGGSNLTFAWANEILGTFPPNSLGIATGTVKRFAHSFITGRSQTFDTHWAIGQVSRDGKFFVFSSDWLGTLGAVGSSNVASCTIGSNCRGDVFIVELR